MTEITEAKQIMGTLEQAFETIRVERMTDIPIINNKLRVQAVDFRLHQGSWLGVMITPWFMNLMRLPGEDSDWSKQTELSEQIHTFPSGRYAFIAGIEPSIGRYQSCSLFSPMFEFADQIAALETARAALKELMNDKPIDAGDIARQPVSRRELLRGSLLRNNTAQ